MPYRTSGYKLSRYISTPRYKCTYFCSRVLNNNYTPIISAPGISAHVHLYRGCVFAFKRVPAFDSPCVHRSQYLS